MAPLGCQRIQGYDIQSTDYLIKYNNIRYLGMMLQFNEDCHYSKLMLTDYFPGIDLSVNNRVLKGEVLYMATIMVPAM